VRGWLLDPVKTVTSASAIRYPSDRNSGVRQTVRKYTRTTAAAAWVGGLSSDHPRSRRSCRIDWIHHLRIHSKLSISSSHLRLESLSRHLIVSQMMRCKNYAQARISAVCRPLMSLLSVHALLVVNALTRSLKSTGRSKAVRIFHCHCISVCMLDFNRHSLFGFFQITGVSNSNPAFELFKFLNQTLHSYRLFTLVVTADCASLKLMAWKLLQLRIFWIFYPLHEPSLRWCAKTETKRNWTGCKGLIILVYFACRSRNITAVVPHFFLSSGSTAYCWISTRNWSFTYWLLDLWRHKKLFS